MFYKPENNDNSFAQEYFQHQNMTYAKYASINYNLTIIKHSCLIM